MSSSFSHAQRSVPSHAGTAWNWGLGSDTQGSDTDKPHGQRVPGYCKVKLTKASSSLETSVRMNNNCCSYKLPGQVWKVLWTGNLTVTSSITPGWWLKEYAGSQLHLGPSFLQQCMLWGGQLHEQRRVGKQQSCKVEEECCSALVLSPLLY